MALTDFARAMKEAENAPDQMLMKEIAQDKSTNLEPLPAAIEKSRRDKMRNQPQRPTTTVLQDIAMQSQKPPMMPPGMPGRMPQGPAPQRPPGMPPQMPPQMPPGMPPQMPPAMPPQMPPAQGGIRGFSSGSNGPLEERSFTEDVLDVFTPDAADLGLLALGATGIGAGVAGPLALIKRLGKIASLGPKAYRAYKGFLGRQAAKKLPEGLSRRLAGGEGLSERVNKAIAQLSRENELVGLGGARRAQQRGFDFSGAVSDATRGATDAFQAALGRNINRGMMGGIGGAMLGSSMFGDSAPVTPVEKIRRVDEDPKTGQPNFGPRLGDVAELKAQINLSRDENIADIMSLGEDIRALDQYKFDKGRGFFQGGQVSGSGVNYELLSPQIREQLEEIEARGRGFGSQKIDLAGDLEEFYGILDAVNQGESAALGFIDQSTPSFSDIRAGIPVALDALSGAGSSIYNAIPPIPYVGGGFDSEDDTSKRFGGMGSSGPNYQGDLAEFSQIVPESFKTSGGGDRFGGMGSSKPSYREDLAEFSGILPTWGGILEGVTDLGTAALSPGFKNVGYTDHPVEQQESPQALIETAERLQSLPSFGENLSPDQAALLASDFNASVEKEKTAAASGGGGAKSVPAAPVGNKPTPKTKTPLTVASSTPSPTEGGASYRDYLNNIFTANKEKHDRMQRGLVLGQVASNLLSGERDFMRGLPELAFGTMDQDIRQQRDLGNVGINMLASDTGLASDQLRARQNQVTQLLGSRGQRIDQLIALRNSMLQGRYYDDRSAATLQKIEQDVILNLYEGIKESEGGTDEEAMKKAREIYSRFFSVGI